MYAPNLKIVVWEKTSCIKYLQLILCFRIDVLEYGHLVHKKKNEKALEDCFRFYFKDTNR